MVKKHSDIHRTALQPFSLRCLTGVSRESLFLLTYLLFLVNTVVGLIAGIWRMVITALYNIIHLGRIDISLLHRTAESFDPGRTPLRSSLIGLLTFLPDDFHNMLPSLSSQKNPKLLCITNKVTRCDALTLFSLQILHQHPEGGGEPVPPGPEGFLRAAAGHDGGERSHRAEDESCRGR